MRQVPASIFSILGTLALWILSALVVFFILVSDGRVLDLRIGFGSRDPASLAVSLLCWSVLVIFLFRLTVGRWRRYRTLKVGLLTGALTAAAVLAIELLMPQDIPGFAKLLLVAGSAGLGTLLSEWIVPLPSSEEPASASH